MRVVINWVRFANGMPRFQEQSTRPQETAVYDLDIIKIKFMVVFHTVLRQKRVLVTCEDDSFMFFCSGSQCSGCLTDVKFFTVFTIDFIHDTSWQVLTEFVLRFLQDRTNRLDGFMSNIYVDIYGFVTLPYFQGISLNCKNFETVNIHFITEEGYSILAETSILRFLSQWQQLFKILNLSFFIVSWISNTFNRSEYDFPLFISFKQYKQK